MLFQTKQYMTVESFMQATSSDRISQSELKESFNDVYIHDMKQKTGTGINLRRKPNDFLTVF